MPQPVVCPQCGSPLPPDSPEGLCRACLLKRGLESNTIGYTEPASTRWQPPTPEQLAPLFPELDILRLLGRGGMGAVYQARQKSLDRLVALKILPPDLSRDAGGGGAGGFAERFTREAQALARLNHPHIVTIHEFGTRTPQPLSASVSQSLSASPLYFFLMEFVDGTSLRTLLDSGHIAPKEALAIVPQICDALQFAHDHGIVHRDIKPENILLNQQGQVKIADFGLAKLMGRTEAKGLRTEPDVPLGESTSSLSPRSSVLVTTPAGTPAYMAPEQLSHPADVDHRADIYSLGVVFYQMLTGELPATRLEPPSRKVQIDVRLDQIVLRALEQSPELRFQNATQFKTEVETVISTTAPSPDQPPYDARAERRAPGWVIRCLTCGLTEPWGKYGIRLNAKGREWTLGWCPRCRRIRCHVVEQRRARATAKSDESAPPATSLAHHLLLWTARILGTLFALLILIFIIGEGSPPLGKQPGAVQIEFAAMALWFLGFAVGWRFESLAAFLILLASAAFHLLERRLFLGGALEIPTLIGLLYLAASLTGPRHRWSQLHSAIPSSSSLPQRGRGRFVFIALVFAAIFLGITAERLFVRFGPKLPVAVAAEGFPQATHLGNGKDSVYLVHDSINLHYVFFFPSEFTTYVRRPKNATFVHWSEDLDLQLQDFPDFFDLYRDSSNPDRLLVNERECDLRLGRVFVRASNGNIRQLPLFPSLATARNLDALDALIANALPHFAPAVEVTLKDADHNLPEAFVDFETGRRLGPPPGTKESAIETWFAESGADLGADIMANKVELFGINMRTFAIASDRWDKLAPEEARQELKTVESKHQAGITISQESLPATYLFDTSRGTTGALQIVAITEESVTLRYKLVITPESQPATSPSSAPVPAARAVSLDFRIAFLRTQIPDADLPAAIDSLAKNGPAAPIQLNGTPARWFEIHPDAQFSPNSDLVLATLNAKSYILCYDDHDHTLIHADPARKPWSISAAKPLVDSSGSVTLPFKLDLTGATYLGELTLDNKNHPLAVLIDDRAINAPMIKSQITDSGLITFGTPTRAHPAAALLKAAQQIQQSLNAAPTSRPSAQPSPAFAPLIEMVLPTSLWTDLDTGKTYSDAELPLNSDINDENEAYQWRQRTSADVLAMIRPTTQRAPSGQEYPAFTGLFALDTRFAQVANSAWDFSAPEIHRLFDTVLLSPATIPTSTTPSRAQVAYIPTTTFPATFLFQTRQGRGILQILGTSDNPQGLRARIRPLLAPTTASAPAPLSPGQ